VCVKASPSAATFVFALNKFYRVRASAIVKEMKNVEISKYFGIKYLFSFLHPYSKGDLGGGLASLACVYTYTWNATRSMCYLNAPSDGGSLTREESFDKAN
jgi:hypothetical protein